MIPLNGWVIKRLGGYCNAVDKKAIQGNVSGKG